MVKGRIADESCAPVTALDVGSANTDAMATHTAKKAEAVFIKPPAALMSPSLAVCRREADEVTHVELPNTLGAKKNCSKLRRESKVITS